MLLKCLKSVFYALFFTLFYMSLVSFHPFHFSVTELKYNTQSHKMEASCKIFINDLENILKKQYGVSYDLYKQNDDVEVKNTLSKYIQKNLAVQVDTKNISFTLLGSEREDAALWIYLESTKVSTPKRVEINNTLLFDLFDDQSNIVHYEQNGQRKSHKLSNPNGKVIF